ncbi:hypothetical protein L1987_53401 [Smallanthus sonchifolius]|uniref:Uncharacterized protein n=1 Tax=Smallanthus sonchifolius TaxID=185202 RepID=A0ACB9EX00_9ASTR|nr:hypothetical protein L1987_53401 [Smallanthus sonchifolius]
MPSPFISRLRFCKRSKALCSFVYFIPPHKDSAKDQDEVNLSVEDGHLCNMGKMMKELEGKLRNQLDQDLCSSSYAIQPRDGFCTLSTQYLCS